MYSEDPCEQKLFKILGENGAWAYPGTIQFFWVPPIISGTGKAMNFKLGGYIHRAHPNKSPLKNVRIGSVGESRDSPTLWSTPYYIINGYSYEPQIWQIYSKSPCELKSIKNLGENGAWAYTGTAQIFWVPPIISGTGKATNFNVCTHIPSIDRNKSPLQISGKVAGCVVRTLKQNFSGHPYIGRIARSSLR